MKRYMMLFKSEEIPQPGTSPCKAQLPEMAKLMGELAAKGILQTTEGLLPSDSGARVRFDDGRMTVRDGPFAEAKELVAGFAVVKVSSRDEAVELAKQFLAIAGTGDCDILEVFEPSAAH